MSLSKYVCFRDGIPLTTHRDGWRHALGGRTGAIPAHKRHKPVPMLRADFERAFGVDTPSDEALGIIRRMRALDDNINGKAG